MTIVFERADRTWPTTPRADWLAAYEPDLDNLRAALGWSLRPDGDPALGLKLVSYTDWLWRELSLLQEQRRWFELALTFVDDATPPSVEARIRLGLGWYFYGGDRGRLSHNLRAIELMRQVGGEPVLLGQALTQAGLSTSRYRDVAEAEQYLRRSTFSPAPVWPHEAAGHWHSWAPGPCRRRCRGFEGCAGPRRRGAGPVQGAR